MNDNAQDTVQPQVQEPKQEPVAPVVSEPVVESPKTEAPQTPQYDPKEIEERVSKSVIERIGEALGLTKKQQEEQIPTEPKELAAYMEHLAERKTNDILTRREEEQKKQLSEAQKRQNESAATFTTLWNRQYKELAEGGRVPKIEKESDPNDPGRLARVRILTKMYEIVQANQQQGIDYVPTLKEVYYEHPDLFKKPDGEDAPISGGGRTEQKSQVPGYKRSWEDILSQRQN